MTSQMTERDYIYEPLDGHRQFRLCHVRPDKLSSPLECTLALANLDNRDEYEALSYAWGSPTASERLNCAECFISVTPTLLAALKSLRQEHTPRVLWIDQLCINQADLAERSNQVRIMRDIYSQAKMVIVWLGECNDQSKQAMQWISNISDALKEREEMGDTSDLEIVRAGVPPPGHEYWAAIQDLLQRPYFTRMWTTPEIKVSRARKVVCGQEEMSWQTLVDFNRRIRLQTQFPYRFFPRGTLPGLELIESISDLWNAEAENEPYGLLDVLRFFRQRLTSDPLDKIIAPLGLAINLGSSFDHLIDYKQTVAELYTRTARMIIDRDCNLDILWSAGKAMQKYQLPSWVPDWMVPSNAALGMIAKEGFEIRAYKESEELDVVYHATDLSKPDYIFMSSEEGESLQVRAIIYGSINWVGASLQCLDEEADIPIPITAEAQLSRLHDCFSATEQCQPYATGEDCISACQQTLFAGCKRGLVYGEFSYAKLEPHEAAQYTNDFFTAVEMSTQHEARSEAGEILECNALEPYLQGYDIFQSSLNVMTTGRRFVTMYDHYVGLASVGSQIGDRICVILGCNVPFVIRSTEGGNYILIGECYVHGLMHGEALRTANRSFEYISLR